MTQDRDLQKLRGFGELRKRYVGVGLRIGCLAYAIRAIEPGASVTMRGIRVAMVVLCIAALRSVPRSKDDALALTRGMIALASVVVLVIAWQDLPGGFPSGLLVLPGLALSGAFFGGAWFGTAVAAVGGGAALGLFAVYPVGARSPLLTTHVTNLLTVLLLTHAFALAIAAKVREGAADLARSTEVLQRVREATSNLSLDVSQRIKAAVGELNAALALGDDALRRTADATAALLAESRAALPDEPELVESRLAEHLTALKDRLAAWSFRLVLLGAFINTLRTLLFPPAHFLLPWILPLQIGGLTVFALLTFLHHLRPRWGRALSLALHAIALAILGSFTASWLDRQVGLPPNLAFWNILPLLATAVVGLPLGLFEVTLGAVIVLVGAWPYTALSWAIPISNALWYGLLCWIVWRVPRNLVAVLSARQAEAAAEIRTRRRLAATLFHDLASPLAVVQMIASLIAEGGGGRTTGGASAKWSAGCRTSWAPRW